MAGVGFAVNIEGAERFTKKMRESPQRIHQGVVRALRLAVAAVTRDAKLAAPVRSGRLRASIRGRVEEHALLGGSFGIVGTNIIYGRIQELGGEIRPRNVQFLTIPIGAAQTASGVTRGPARSFPNTLVLRSRAGKLLIMQRAGRGGLRPLFVLVRRVQLSPNPYLGPALEGNRRNLVQWFGREVKTALEAN